MNKVIDKGFRSCRFVSTIVKHPVYIAIKSAGRRYTISLLVGYNSNLDFRSFCYTVAGCQTHFH